MTQEIIPNSQEPQNQSRLSERIQKNKEEFLETFRECTGIITIACQRKGISRATFYNWFNSDPEFKEKVEGIKKEQIGVVEDRLLKAILEDNLSAIIFYLKSKHPEYKPKSEISFDDRTKVNQALDKIEKLINP